MFPPPDQQSYFANLLSGLGNYARNFNPFASPANVPQGQPSSVYDDAARAMNAGTTDVFSRFTKTPISIIGYDPTGERRGYPRSGGRYFPDKGKADVFLPPNPTWADLQGTIHHEDIHSALRGFPAELPDELLRQRTNPETSNQFGPTVHQSVVGRDNPLAFTYMLDEFQDANRAGNAYNELPAYMGAYKPWELPGITPQMAADWLKRYAGTLPSTTAKTVNRISESNKAAQRVK